MEACAVICRKATVALPDANFFSFYAALPSSRAQNRVFCAFWGFGTPIFGLFEHRNPSFSGISSKKSAFLCSGRRGLAPGCVNIAFLQFTAMQSCGQMLPAELATLPHRPWTPMSSVNGRVPASEAQREGWSEAEVCAEEVVNPQKPLR